MAPRTKSALVLFALIAVQGLDIVAPWFVYRWMDGAWDLDMWPITGVAAAACLYYSGDFVEGRPNTRFGKVLATRAIAFALVVLIGNHVPAMHGSMHIDRGCECIGDSSLALYEWTEAYTLVFAVPAALFLWAFRRPLLALGRLPANKNSILPRPGKRAEFEPVFEGSPKGETVDSQRV